MDFRLNIFTLVTTTSVAISLTGCGQQETAQVTAEAHEVHEHDHAEEGPHEGHLIELGHEYHAELVHDETARKVTIYVLDGQAIKNHPVDSRDVTINLVVQGAPKQFALPALPLPHDPAGQTSCFEIVDQALCDAICEEGARGRLNVKIAGKPYVGIIEHHHHH